MAALKYTLGDYVVLLDDDGQCPVDRTFDLISQLDNGYDIAVAKYKKRRKVRLKTSAVLLTE